MCCPWCCLGHRARPLGRAGRIANADGCYFCLAADTPARSHHVPRLTGWVLEIQNQYLVSYLCLWFVLRSACCRCRLLAGSLLRCAGVLHLVRLLG